MTPRPSRIGAPIAVQIGILVALCLIVAQGLALLVITLSPPPGPQVYRLSEVAAALQGGPLETALGRPLMRSVSDEPPARFRPRRSDRPNPGGQRVFGGRGAAALAALIGVPPDRVRIARPPPSLTARLLAGQLGAPQRSARLDRPPPRPDRPERGPAPPPGLDDPRDGPRGGPDQPPEIDIVGDFTAAVRQDDGRWLQVRPRPEAFPNDWQRKAGLWMLGCLAVASAAGWLFARRITAPIDRFAEAAERLGREPNASAIRLDGPAEIGKAARAFNEMQVRLKRYVEDRTAMVGAISHDLRTPLARIRFKLEAKTPDPAAILTDVQRMEAMIGSVLAFIRDASAVSVREKLDLLSVVEVVVDDAALVGGAVQIVEAQPATVNGDALALQRLLSNLVDNALKYGSAARVRLSAKDGLAVVEIEDDGPGMSPVDLARAFEPFYRADASRNLDQGGVGLGLAVARSLARAHGGDVELANRPGGMTARVTLPLA